MAETDADSPQVHLARTAAPHEVHPDELARERLILATYLGHHVRLVTRFLSASEGDLYLTDMFLVGAAQRSYHVVQGFLSTWDTWNVVAAAPLARMQIDTLLRTSYAARSENSEEVVRQLLKQDSFRKLKDPQARPLTDRRLVELASEHYSWLPPVYEKANEWVHFSTRHIFNAWRLDGAEEEDSDSIGRVSGTVPLDPGDIPVAFLAELVGVMNEATSSLFGLFEAWESRKGRPPGEIGPPLGPDGSSSDEPIGE